MPAALVAAILAGCLAQNNDHPDATEQLLTPLEDVAPLAATTSVPLAQTSFQDVVNDLDAIEFDSELLGPFHLTVSPEESPVQEAFETINGEEVPVVIPLFFRVSVTEHPDYKGFISAVEADNYLGGVVEYEAISHEIQIVIHQANGAFEAILADYRQAHPAPLAAMSGSAADATCVNWNGECTPVEDLRHDDQFQVEVDTAQPGKILVKVYYDLSFKTRWTSPLSQINSYVASSNDKIFVDETPYKVFTSVTSTNKNHASWSTDGRTNWQEFITDYSNNEASWKDSAINYNGERFKLFFSGYATSGVGGEARVLDGSYAVCDYWVPDGSKENYCGQTAMYTGGETASYHGTIQNMGYVLSHELIHSLVYYDHTDGDGHDQASKKKESDGSICSRMTSRNIMYHTLATSACDHIHGWATTEQECYIQVGAEFAMDHYPPGKAL